MGLWYAFGTCSITNGETTVTLSTGATALNSIKAGDELRIANFAGVEVASVTNNTTVELVKAWPNTTQSDASYAVVPGPGWNDTATLAKDVSDYLNAISGLISSDSSVEIGTGSKTFTVPANLRLSVGARVRASDTANPTTKYMEGVVTGYAGTTLTVSVDVTEGSGTPTSWNINPSGANGADGRNFEPDATGTFAERDAHDDEAAGFAYLSTDGDGDTITTACFFFKDSATSGDWSDASPLKGDKGDTGDTGATGATGAAGADGADGADGTDPGYLLTFGTATTAPPDSGGILADNASLASATKLYVSKTARGGSDIGARLTELDPGDKAEKNTVILTNPANDKQASFSVDSVTDKTGYVEIAVSSHAGETAFAAGAISLQREISGADGADGEDGTGTGDVSGPSSSTDGYIPVFDGTTGKLLKTGGGTMDGDLAVLGNFTFTAAKNITSGTDLNELTTSGAWNGTGLTNTPNDAQPTWWWYVEVIRHTNDNGYCLQRATTMTTTALATYERTQVSETWGDWKQIPLGASADGIALVAAANYAAMRALLDLEAGTDFYSKSAADTLLAGKADTATTLAGYGITDAEPLGKETIVTKTASATLALTDAGKLIRMNVASANDLTIPANSSVAFPVETRIDVAQSGAGVTTVKGDTGVTVNGVSAGSGEISQQYGAVCLIKTGTDTWEVYGAIGDVA